MDMWTLPTMSGGRGTRSVPANSYVELQRQGLRREAGIICASLVVKLAMNREPARHGGSGAGEEGFDREFF